MLFQKFVPALTFAVLAAAAPTKRQVALVPAYVKAFAPLIYLYSGESYFPSDLSIHLANTSPESNFTPIPFTDDLSDLSALNVDTNVYITAGANQATSSPRAAWLSGQKPVNGLTAQMPVIVVDKGNGTVDAFYFTFYSFNEATKVVGIAFGAHVGDWEHVMIRFLNGMPQAIWLSQHSSGQAFTYSAIQKNGIRPVVYSATGSHALYAIPGTHDHVFPGEIHLPTGFLVDKTDAGTLWDPVLNSAYFTYSVGGQTFAATGDNPSFPTAWLDFTGYWGDKQYPSGTPDQYTIFGQSHYGDGPTGPRDKGLDRPTVCLGLKTCTIFPLLIPKKA